MIKWDLLLEHKDGSCEKWSLYKHTKNGHCNTPHQKNKGLKKTDNPSYCRKIIDKIQNFIRKHTDN